MPAMPVQPEPPPHPSRFRSLVLSELRQVRGPIALAAVCVLGSTLAALAAPWPLKLAFDRVLLPTRTPPSGLDAMVAPWLGGEPLAAIGLLCGALMLIALLAALCGFVQQMQTQRIGFRIVHRLRSTLFEHVQQLPLSFHSRARSGELMSKITADTTTLRDVCSESVLVFTTHALTLVGMLALLLTLDLRLGALATLSFPPLLLLLLQRLRRITASARRQRSNEGRLAHRVGEMLQSVSLVQAYGREQQERDRFDDESRRATDESLRTSRAEAAAGRLIELVTAAATALILAAGGWLTLRGELSPGSLLVCMAYVSAMFKPVKQLSKLAARMAKARASIERIEEILALQPEGQDAADAVAAPVLRGDIRFEQVSVRHEERTVLHDIDLHIPAGIRVAIVGPSGAGKSTLARLLVRLIEPHAGRVCIDGTDVRRWTRRSLREQIGMVLQDNLLSGSRVRDNIAYGREDASEAQIVAAAKLARAHDFICALPGGYDHVLGPGGATLSGGQRQRLCLARALIKDPPILLLDEPTSALDASAERQVRAAIASAHAGRTSIVIAHQLHSVLDADLIVVLQDGRIVQQGRHAELIAQAGAYRTLFGTAETAPVEGSVPPDLPLLEGA
ncbi:ABC transporter ATP-binding protein [Sphaerotilus mobilis]|nr:ABC transporter ATP-binding protein [Sphaerotilus mobilis]